MKKILLIAISPLLLSASSICLHNLKHFEKQHDVVVISSKNLKPFLKSIRKKKVIAKHKVDLKKKKLTVLKHNIDLKKKVIAKHKVDLKKKKLTTLLHMFYDHKIKNKKQFFHVIQNKLSLHPSLDSKFIINDLHYGNLNDVKKMIKQIKEVQNEIQ